MMGLLIAAGATGGDDGVEFAQVLVEAACEAGIHVDVVIVAVSEEPSLVELVDGRDAPDLLESMAVVKAAVDVARFETTADGRRQIRLSKWRLALDDDR